MLCLFIGIALYQNINYINYIIMSNKRICEMPDIEPRKSNFNFEDLIKKLSAINNPESGVNIQNDITEAILCLANEITNLKEENALLQEKIELIMPDFN